MDSLETAKTPPVEEATESLPTEPDTATQYVETGISASPELIGGDLVEVSSKSEPPADTPDGDNDGSSHSVSADENDRGTDDEYEPTSADDDEEFGEKSSSGGIPKRKKAPFKKVAIPVNERLANHVRDEKPCMASDEEDLQDEIFMLEMTEATLRNREHRRAKEGQTLSAKDKEKLEKTQKRLTELAREWPHLARKKNQGDMPDTSDVKPNHAKSRAASLKISTKGSRKRKTGDSGEAPQSAKKIKTNPQKPEAQRKKVAPVRKTLGSSSVLSDVLSGRTSIHDRASSDGVSAKPIVASQLQDQLDQMRDRAFQLPNVDKSRIKADEKNLQIARGAFGPSWVSPVDGGWLIKNMRIPLYDHQLDGGGWMINRERFDDEPQGGILADEMGLGKTLTCLALIVKRRPGRGEEVSPTLVLVPNEAMAVQWLAEIERHCIDLFAQRYRRNEKLTTATLKTVSVLVATYSEVERCWNQHMPTTNEKTFKKQPLDQSLHLFNVTFHRIMYDECHIIKNHLSKTAKAVFNLKAKYRWLISATPTPNDPDELYPYLKILGLPWTENIKLYHENFYNKKLNNTDKLQPIIQKIMLRRLTKSTVMGMELFDDVPETKSEIIRKAFSVEEKIIYDAVVKTLQKELHEQSWNLNLKSKSKGNSLGDTKEESEKLLHKVLQLHKLTAHPFMFESMLAKTFPLEQLAEIRSDLEAYGGKSSLIDQIGRMFPQKDHKQDHDMSAGSFGKSQHGGIFNMKPQLDMTLKRRAIEERFCPGPLCARREIPVEALRLECGHTYHKDCWEHQSLATNVDGQPAFCLQDKRKIYAEPELINQSEFAGLQYVEDAAQPAKKSTKSKTKLRKRGDDFNGHRPRGESSTFLAENDRSHPFVPLTASTKTTTIKDIILGWLRDAPDDKIIVFTQWILVGMITGRMLEDEGVNFLYYFGEMTKDEKAQNLETFKNGTEVKVLVMGLRCGGIGLDLYQANRVILVDPWWNSEGEDQAFARVLRKVQRKTTYLIKILIEDSIDMRVHHIQETKSAILSSLVKEDDPNKRSLATEGRGLELAKMLIAADEENDGLQEENKVVISGP